MAKAAKKRVPTDPRAKLLKEIKGQLSSLVKIEGQRDACLNKLYVATYGYIQHGLTKHEGQTAYALAEGLGQECGRHPMYWLEAYYSGKLITEERLSISGPRAVRGAAVRWLARTKRAMVDANVYRKCLKIVREGGTRADCIKIGMETPQARAQSARQSALLMKGKGRLTKKAIMSRAVGLAEYAAVHFGKEVSVTIYDKDDNILMETGSRAE